MVEYIKQASHRFLSTREDLGGVDVFNNWRLLLTDYEIQSCVRYCADVINKKFKGKDILLCGILKGCVPFMGDLMKLITIPYSVYYIEASSYHNQTQEAVQVLNIIVPEKVKNKHVILIDDLFDKGTTFYYVKQHLIEMNIPPNMIYTCAPFKKNRETDYPPPDIYALVVPNLWLVGFGLDFVGLLRGWTHLYACPKSEGIPLADADEIFDNDKAYENERLKLMKQLMNF